MKRLILSNINLLKNAKLLESISEIGFIYSVVLICATENFKKFETHRKFACFFGIAPFENSSVRGKTRVSSLANRKIKTYLTSAAITAVKWDPQLKKYYERKLEQGKHKVSVLKAINKTY